MATAAGIWNQQMTSGQALSGTVATPMTGPASSTSTTSSDSSDSSSSATITANDFLTLLVTEMQNQDPTAETDPNEYINQLVQVNSLEQLININQNVATALGDSTTSSTTETASSAGSAGGAASTLTNNSASGQSAGLHGATQKSGALASTQTTGSSTSTAAQTAAAKLAPGNLSVPEAKPAAQRVAQALGGQSRAY